MNFWQLRNQFYDLICFNINQVYAWQPGFDKNNLTRWVKQNLLVKLRNSWYSFPDYIKMSNIQYFVSNKIYSPSYVSLHSALAFYGIIPEAIVQTTAVSSLKKANIENSFPPVIRDYEVEKLARVPNTIKNESVILKIFPNPTSDNANIEYYINRSELIEISIHDNCGKPLYKLKNKSFHEAGTYQIKLNGINLPSGIYYCILQTDSIYVTKELIISKY